jgi:hypothetical protein
MCNCVNRCFELQEIVTDAAQVSLPDNTRIRRNMVTSLYVQPSDPAGTLAYYSPQGRELAAWDVLNSSYLYAYNQNGTLLAPIPLAQLVRTTEDQEMLRVSWAQIDPTQSFIKINTSAAGYDATHAFVLLWGLDCDDCGVTPNNR